jgi:transposase
MDYEAIIAQKDTQINQQAARIEELIHQISQLQKLIYGRKSERFIPQGDSGQLSIFGDQQSEPSDVEEQKETITYDRSKKKSDHKGRQLLSGCEHLSVEEKIIDTDHDESDIHIGDEVSEKLAYKPGKLYRIRYIRRKYKKANQDTIITAPPVEEPIARCEADVSLLANVVVSKYVDHIPEYRQQQIYKREGVVIAPSTMNGWVHQLSPYMKLMSEYIKQKILQSGYIQQDESTIKVMDGKKQGTHTGYMWVMGAPGLQYVCFEYHKGRGREGPIDNLKDYKGHLQTDAYQVYEMIDKLYGDVEHFNCWAHGRRKFVEAMANDKPRSEYALGQIQKLYAIEQKCRDNGCTYDERKEERQAANPILEQLKDWLDAEAIKVTPRSPIGKAISYLTTRWQKFTKYTGHGIVEIDNNIIENAIRPLALGRKNYLFAGNHDAATTIAYYYTIFGTCKALGVNPYDYMVWFLSKVAYTKLENIGNLAPDAYIKAVKNIT